MLKPEDTYHHNPVPFDTTCRKTWGAAAVPVPAPIILAGTDAEVETNELNDTTAATLMPVLARVLPAAIA